MYVFCGSDLFSRGVLEGLHRVQAPVAILTQPDRPTGRQMKVRPGPLSAFAKEHGIACLQPLSLKDPSVQNGLCHTGADLFMVVSYGRILPRSLLDRLPATLNAHASLLPAYRGASPIQSALLAGDRETGVSIMRIVPALDAGPVLSRHIVAIEPEDQHASLSAKLIAASIEGLTPWLTRRPVAAGVPQDDAKASTCGKFCTDDERLEPSKFSPIQLNNRIRAFSPKPGAWMDLQHESGSHLKLKVLRAGPFPKDELGETPAPGQLTRINRKLALGCIGGVLELSTVKPEGRGEMDAASFLNGHPGIWNVL